MAKLTSEMKTMIAENQCFVATASRDGVPNIGPKRSTRVLDDQHLLFNEGTGRRTLQYLRENPKVAVAVVNAERSDGYRFFGTAELLDSGELYESARAEAAKVGRPAPQALVRITVEEIYTLKPGQAGLRIDA